MASQEPPPEQAIAPSNISELEIVSDTTSVISQPSTVAQTPTVSETSSITQLSSISQLSTVSQTPIIPESSSIAQPSIAQAPAVPRFPSPSECSKWLMLFWFAGYSPAKIRSLLSQWFKLDGHKEYNVENIESTFRRLQRSADRNTGDYQKDPYMWYIMTTKSASPFEFRQSAIRWLERNHPEIAAEMINDVEIKEMNAWHYRWMEEVRLMQKSKAEEYRKRAAIFEEQLDHWTQHFDNKSHVDYLESNDDTSAGRKGRGRAKSTNPSPERKPSATRHSVETSLPIGEVIRITNIERPQLSLRTKMGQMFSRSKREGTPTPSTAQHLDDFGFFAHRPKPSAGSVIGARSRTPSMESTPNTGVSSS